jgi:thiamine kinase-like enzyme
VEADPAVAAVIEAVPAWAGRTVLITPIAAGITNRNFRVDVDREAFVVRIPGRDTELLGIDRHAERRATQAAFEAGVAPEVVAYVAELEALVTRFVEADPLPPEDLEDPATMATVVASVRAIHGMAEIPSTFDVFSVVREYRTVAQAHGVSVSSAYHEVLAFADRIAESFSRHPLTPCPCHDDLLNANFLRTPDRVVIVDYEYAGMGDRFFDLGNLAVNNGISEDAQASLLECYFGRATAANRARLSLMRIMSDFREAMWGVVQQGISTLEFDYVDYADRHFRRCLESAADPRFGGWLRDAPGELT